MLIAVPKGRRSPLVGTVVWRYRVPSGTFRYTVILDAPTADGDCVADVCDDQLVVLRMR